MNLGGVRWLGFGHWERWRARGREWVGPGGSLGVRKGERRPERARGWPYMARRWCTTGSCAGELVLVATGHGSSSRCVWGVPGFGPELGGEEREQGGLELRACELGHWGSRAAGARAKGGNRREKEEGARGMACCGRRGVSTGVRGRPEVVGGCGVNGRERDDVLQSASLAGIRGFSARTRAPTCVW